MNLIAASEVYQIVLNNSEYMRGPAWSFALLGFGVGFAYNYSRSTGSLLPSMKESLAIVTIVLLLSITEYQ